MRACARRSATRSRGGGSAGSRWTGAVPHPTTLMKLTTRCGSAAVAGLNEALLAKAAEAKLLRTARLRADTTVIPANVSYPTDSGLLARAIRRIAATGRRIQAAGGATRTRVRDRSRAAGRRAHAIAVKLSSRAAQAREDEAGRGGRGRPGNSRPGRTRCRRRRGGCWPTRAGRCAAPRRRRRPWPRQGSGTPPRAGGGAGCAARSATWPSCWRSPARSRRRPGSGSRATMPDGATRRVSLHDAGRPADRQGPARQARRVRVQGPGHRQRRRRHPRLRRRAGQPRRRPAARPGHRHASSSGPGKSPGP